MLLLVALLFLLSRTISMPHADASTSILKHPALGIGDEKCLSTSQLRGALEKAAMPPHASVVMTNCDFKCMDTLFVLFMSAVADAGFSQHVVVVAIGERAATAEAI